MKAREIRDTILRRATWVDPRKTVDTFKLGDPDVEVTGAAVMWMLTTEAIDEVERLGVNLVVTHEPTFYSHTDDVAAVKSDPVYKAKRRRLEKAALTVLRLHDSWDIWPRIGVGDSLGRALGLRAVRSRHPLLKAWALKSPTRLDAFAEHVRRTLGMDAVGVMGEPARKVRRVALAFGALGGIDHMRAFLSLKPDVIVAGELSHWRDVRYLQDAGCPLILTDHAASENPGLRSLAAFLRKQFRIPTHFIEVGCPLRACVEQPTRTPCGGGVYAAPARR